MSKKPKKKTKKTNSLGLWFRRLVGMTLLCGVFVGAWVWHVLSQAYPTTQDKQLLVIKSGENYSKFIQDLHQTQGISSPLILKIYQKIFIQDSMKAGVYEVDANMTVRQVLDMVSNADRAQMNRVMVIEGTTSKQLLARLSQDPKVQVEVSHLPPAQMLKALDIPYTHPEGLFAPDTYFYAKQESDSKILKDLYLRQMQYLDEAWENRAADLPYKNKYEALIMASIIEKETALDRERNTVAGVFIRRLKLGMRLQTDPTVIYGMGDAYNGNITRKDLRTPTAYNTYTMSGLPPTPIALPSRKSIEAAMHPDDSDYIYFVATGDGGHKFSTNLADHNTAVQEYLVKLRAQRAAKD